MLAGEAPVWTRAVHVQAAPAGEERQAALAEDILDLRRHLPGEQLGAVEGLRSQCSGEPVPLIRVVGRDSDLDLVRSVPRSLDPRRDPPGTEIQVEDLTGARVRAPAAEPALVADVLEDVDEPARPPLLADRAPLTACADAALDANRARGLEPSAFAHRNSLGAETWGPGLGRAETRDLGPGQAETRGCGPREVETQGSGPGWMGTRGFGPGREVKRRPPVRAGTARATARWTGS